MAGDWQCALCPCIDPGQDSVFILDEASATQRQHKFSKNDAVLALYQTGEVDGVATSIYAPGRVRLLSCCAVVSHGPQVQVAMDDAQECIVLFWNGGRTTVSWADMYWISEEHLRASVALLHQLHVEE